MINSLNKLIILFIAKLIAKINYIFSSISKIGKQNTKVSCFSLIQFKKYRVKWILYIKLKARVCVLLCLAHEVAFLILSCHIKNQYEQKINHKYIIWPNCLLFLCISSPWAFHLLSHRKTISFAKSFDGSYVLMLWQQKKIYGGEIALRTLFVRGVNRRSNRGST